MSNHPRSRGGAEAMAAAIRRRVLELSHRAHVGHIGSCLSVADLLAAVYTAEWFQPCRGPDRDRFVLGKGHAGLALYCALEATGRIDPQRLDTFGTDGSPFGVHPEQHLDGVDFSTGSLGQGLGMAVGAALAARVLGSQRNVVALISDAECNAGATWEAAQFAGHHRLGRLLCIVDVNGQQALGQTEDVLDQTRAADRWRSVGWEVRGVDGHDHARLAGALIPSPSGPVVALARTVFGRGVGFMEGELDWHYLPMTDEQYSEALRSIGVGR